MVGDKTNKKVKFINEIIGIIPTKGISFNLNNRITRR